MEQKQTQAEFLEELKGWQKETLEHLVKEHGGKEATEKTLREGIVAIKKDTPEYADNIVFWWGQLFGLHQIQRMILKPTHGKPIELTERMYHGFMWTMLIVSTLVIEDSEKN